ncbi:Protein gp15 [Leuconostoc kimchii IMSNU 11154]|uniref:Protein gp15 n=1 Tax=Leuconostoc kimchii (strain IMSNU 11154 / KCTC 2386 / IH25) TaxID=762051 RepID=D5T4L2_LEUKI|nr:Gp15 family bacteriophage protein [Leuconostoc kimchii]ADG41483.1 Protein gp15 [Leuconostoc kimchii IMSNU 11154]
MFSFTKRPETTIKLLDGKYRLNLAFNVVIEAFGVLDTDLSDAEKVERCFNLLVIDKLPTNDLAVKGDIVAGVFQYINERPYGNEEDDGSQATDEQSSAANHADFDYEQDAGAIYASFLMYYHIDLNQMIDRMHWDQFKALFDNLGADTPIQKIRQYRSDDLSQYADDPKQAQFVSQMQFYYHLDKEVESDGFSSNASSIFDMMMNDSK